MRGTLSNRDYYLYATGSHGSIGQAPKGQDGGVFCIQHDRFVFPNRNHEKGGVLDCGGGNLQSKLFFKADTGGAPNHTHHLQD